MKKVMDKMQRREYEQREKALRDYYSYATENYEDGYDKGKIDGKIAEDTGLSIEEIKKLQA